MKPFLNPVWALTKYRFDCKIYRGIGKTLSQGIIGTLFLSKKVGNGTVQNEIRLSNEIYIYLSTEKNVEKSGLFSSNRNNYLRIRVADTTQQTTIKFRKMVFLLV